MSIDIGTIVGVNYPSPETAGQLHSEVATENAATLIYAMANAISAASATADEFSSINIPLVDDETALAKLLDSFGAPGDVYFEEIAGPFIGVAGAEVPAKPTLGDIATPTVAAAPAYVDRSNVMPAWDESLWDAELLGAAKLKLLQDLANGGYGIEPADEAALWERERERELTAGETAIQEASRQVAARGFSLPPGALAMQISKAQQQALDKSSTASRDIALKRADLYVENRKFTFEMAAKVDQILLEYINAYYTRSLEYVKTKLDAYRVSVGIYESEIKAYMAKIEAQGAAVRMQATAQRAKLDAYLGELSAYEVKMRTALQAAELNLKSFSARVEQSTARADAQYKDGQLKAQAALARSNQKLAAVQTAMAGVQGKIGALEAAAKLYAAPTDALAGIARAYIDSQSSIAAKIE